MSDTITVIRARRGKRLAKTVHADGRIEDYDEPKRFDLFSCQVSSLEALVRPLTKLLARPDCAVVRGVPIDPARRLDVRRLAYADRKTGDPATLEPAPHAWVALDMDRVERPAYVPADDLLACAEIAIQRLPSVFRSAACIIQATASHGIKPGCRLRLWYWLDRLTSDGEMTRWLRRYPVDASVFRTVQPIYTAAPIFNGCKDHLPCRIAVRPGIEAVAIPSAAALAPPPPKPIPPMPEPGDSRAARYAFAALTHAATRVQGTGEGGRHAQILKEARALGRFISAGLLTVESVRATLVGAGTKAGKPEHEVESIVGWALDHPSARPLPDGVRP